LLIHYLYCRSQQDIFFRLSREYSSYQKTSTSRVIALIPFLTSTATDKNDEINSSEKQSDPNLKQLVCLVDFLSRSNDCRRFRQHFSYKCYLKCFSIYNLFLNFFGRHFFVKRLLANTVRKMLVKLKLRVNFINICYATDFLAFFFPCFLVWCCRLRNAHRSCFGRGCLIPKHLIWWCIYGIHLLIAAIDAPQFVFVWLNEWTNNLTP